MKKAIVVVTSEQVSEALKAFKSETGLTMTEQQDNASSYEEKGKGISYCLQFAQGDASTRCQVWLTARKTTGLRYDMYIGSEWIKSGTIVVDGLKTYRTGNDCGKGNSYKGVPFEGVVEWFKVNKLGKYVNATKATKKRNTNARKEQTA